MAPEGLGKGRAAGPAQPPSVIKPERLSAVREALRMRAQADRMLAALSVTRNGTDLVGQLAELLVATATGGSRTGSSHTGFDVLTPNGVRIQVKGRMGAAGQTGKQIFMRGFDGTVNPFDELVFVQFGPNYELERAVRFRVEVLRPILTHIPHTNTWRARMGREQLVLGEDVTEAVRQAYDAM
jgi:hypothetical protein